VTNVLVVDDSAVVRQAFTMLLGKQFAIETAADPIIAEQKIRKRRPDVVVLDLQMPRMDGLTFLRQLMRKDPLPVVICSANAAQGSEPAMRALEEGAVDVILKPAVGVRAFLEESALVLADTLRAAAQARVAKRMPVRPRLSADVVLPPVAVGGQAVGGQAPSPVLPVRAVVAPRVVAVGASTGGTEALRVLIEALPPGAPAMVVVQHMPAGFTGAFARRLDTLSRVEVKEAEHGDAVRSGRVLIAPGDQHMILRRTGSAYHVQLSGGPLVSRHRPSVDVLFRSVAQAAGPSATGILMTGMGDDGAEGLSEMHDAGAHTVAQDEATSVVFGMPKEAIQRGAVDDVLPLGAIAAAAVRGRRAAGHP
jgi:two-component system chemotaxis response regulator CheB